MNTEYTKLSALVDNDILIKEVGAYQWKMWDAPNNKMLMSHDWMQGYQKRYPITCDKGKLECSQVQLGGMLEAVSAGGKANLVGASLHIKSNGKTGKEIAYYFNAIEPKEEQLEDPFPEEPGEAEAGGMSFQDWRTQEDHE